MQHDDDLDVTHISADEDATGSFVTRLFSRFVRIRPQVEEDASDDFEHQSDFYVRFVDLSEHDIPVSETLVSEIHLWSLLHDKRLRYPLLLMLIFAVLFAAGSSPYAPLLASTSTQTRADRAYFTLSIDEGANPAHQTQSSFKSVVTIPGVAIGRNITPKGPAIWRAAPAPRNCPPGPSVDATQSVGRAPVWVEGFTGPSATLHLAPITTSSLLTWQGWSVPLQVGVKFSFMGPVVLTIGNAGNGPIPVFDGGTTSSFSSALVFTNPHTQKEITENPVKNVAIWNITLHLAGAGCYYLTADWPGGNWEITFTAGT